jgi:hypothetical protein
VGISTAGTATIAATTATRTMLAMSHPVVMAVSLLVLCRNRFLSGFDWHQLATAASDDPQVFLGVC